MIIAIDPGKKHCGVALRWGPLGDLRLAYSEGEGVELARSVRHTCVRLACDAGAPHFAPLRGLTVVLEQMHHSRDRRESNANDLIAVASTGAFVAGYLMPEHIAWVTANEWKGSTPKAIDHARTLRTLAGPGDYAAARADLEALGKTKAKHVLDACGILFAFERGKGR